MTLSQIQKYGWVLGVVNLAAMIGYLVRPEMQPWLGPLIIVLFSALVALRITRYIKPSSPKQKAHFYG